MKNGPFGPTFAPNTGIGSKTSTLAKVSEESGVNSSPSKPSTKDRRKRSHKRHNTHDANLIETLQQESDIAQQKMMKKLKLEMH